MRQERIRKSTTRRKPRTSEYGPLTVTTATDTSAAQDVLERIEQVLEIM